MKYDLIVVGAGPGGLMAAKEAAAAGLKVALVERKKDITEVNRACVQIFYINKITPNPETGKGESKNDGYVEPVSVEIVPERALMHFPKPGFTFEFAGPLRAYHNWVQYSPGGKLIHRYQPEEKVWGFHFRKEALLATILADVEKAGVEIITGTMATGATDDGDGVTVTLRTDTGEKKLEAKKLIAADGLSSKIVESLGFNEGRAARPTRRILLYVLEGVQGQYTNNAWMSWTIPSLAKTGNIFMGLLSDGRNLVGLGSTVGDTMPADILNAFLKYPKVQHIFGDAKVVGKLPTAITARTPIKDPARGNVLLVGDSASSAETWVQGAMASGYQAVKSIIAETDGKPGNDDYNNWWLRAFAFNRPVYAKILAAMYPLSRLCTDDELDYIYDSLGEYIGIPQLLLAEHIDIIKKGRPELYEKLAASIAPKK
jgi:digeranylgeranylglycerophospholipid reductase